jgi:predicted secreted hydrolase
LLQGPNGYSRKSATESAASHYYSITRLETRGRITVPSEWMNATEFEDASGSALATQSEGTKGSALDTDSDGRAASAVASGSAAAVESSGATFDVAGLSWMDHEFSSNQLGQNQVGWDWFALQLDDGDDVMLYMLRDATGIDYAHGTLLKRDGSVEWLEPGDWSLEAREEHGGYPSSWSLRIADRDLEIVPLALDQENVSAIIPGLRYWEGAVELHADGKRAGQGYVELTGYGDSGRLPF